MKRFSICIPSYNRSSELYNLLQSIDKTLYEELEIIICEDNSSARDTIEGVVEKFKSENPNFTIHFHKNPKNLGYDSNLVNLINKSNGEFIIFMGDDDKFITENMKDYFNFIKKNNHLSYFLRRYKIISHGGEVEEFRYFKGNKFFNPSLDTVLVMLRRSVFISGFTFKRESVLEWFNTSKFNGTLLYQLFICSELSLNFPSAYCDIPITIMSESERGVPEFGSSETEKSLYEPGVISRTNSINFIKSFLKITKHIDKKYDLDLTTPYLISMSKYSYPILSIQSDKGKIRFINYVMQLIKEVKLNITPYFYLYFLMLLILGKKWSDYIIRILKKIIGFTPNL